MAPKQNKFRVIRFLLCLPFAIFCVLFLVTAVVLGVVAKLISGDEEELGLG